MRRNIMAYCEQCGAKNIDGAAVCAECGSALPPDGFGAGFPQQQPQNFSRPPAPSYAQPPGYPPPPPSYGGSQQGYGGSYGAPPPYSPAPTYASTEPVTLGDWMITYLIQIIPLVNIIMLFVWAFDSGTKLSKKNWARATLIWAIIAIVLSIIFSVAIVGLISSTVGWYGIGN